MRKVINLLGSRLFGANCKLQLLNLQRCSSRLQRQRRDQMEPQNHHRVPACAGDTCTAGPRNMKVSETHACGAGSPREARGTGLETITRADNFGAAAAGFVTPSGSENYNSPPRQQLMVERRPADANRPTLQLIIHTKGRAPLNTAELFSTLHRRGKMLIPVASIEERSVNITLVSNGVLLNRRNCYVEMLEGEKQEDYKAIAAQNDSHAEG